MALTLLTLFSTSCIPILNSLKDSPRREQSFEKDKKFQDVEDVTVGSQPLLWDNKESETFTDEVYGLIRNQDFAGLDTMAADLRTSKARFEKGGGWKIHSLYSLSASPNGNADADWLARIDFLKSWKATTQSIAARASLADAYISYAWEARGQGAAAEVSPNAWPVFNERMKMAAAEIEEANMLEERCYGFFEVLLRLGRGGGMDRSQFEKAFQKSIDYDPTYRYFYTEKAQYLLPRWHGRPGELADFAESLVETQGEAEGLKLYYLIVATLRDYKHDNDLFKETGLSWKKTKKGFVQYEKDHGITRFRLNEFAALAWTAKDPQAACNTHRRLTGKDDFEASIWKSREAFEQRKAFVLNLMCQLPRADNQAQ